MTKTKRATKSTGQRAFGRSGRRPPAGLVMIGTAAALLIGLAGAVIIPANAATNEASGTATRGS